MNGEFGSGGQDQFGAIFANVVASGNAQTNQPQNADTLVGSVKIKEPRHVKNPHHEFFARNNGLVSNRRKGSNFVNNADVIHVLVEEGNKSKRSRKSKKHSQAEFI